MPMLDKAKIVHCFKEYMQREDNYVSQIAFLGNMEAKLQNKEFCEDIFPLLPKHVDIFNANEAYEYVRQHLLEYE